MTNQPQQQPFQAIQPKQVSRNELETVDPTNKVTVTNNNIPDDDDMIDPVALAIALMNEDTARQGAASIKSAVLTNGLMSAHNGGDADNGAATGAALTAALLAGKTNTSNNPSREFVLKMVNGPARIHRSEFLKQYNEWETEQKRKQKKQQQENLTGLFVMMTIIFITCLVTGLVVYM